LCLALVGLYAVTAHAVIQRTHEIGIRVAFGARPLDMAWLVLRRALIQLGGGLVLGIICVLVLRPFGAAPANPAVLTAVSATVLVVSLIACLAPALRAARLDPVTALRRE
jgi:ABC-type antimicrobial peptide transport system permease subunit